MMIQHLLVPSAARTMENGPVRPQRRGRPDLLYLPGGGAGLPACCWACQVIERGLRDSPPFVLPLLVIFLREPLGKLLASDPDWEAGKDGATSSSRTSFELFEVLLSFVTNTMSFLRVGAFVLVHAGMMVVVFTLAEMVGGGASPVVIVLGNLFVMGMEGLMVGIQVLRLEFYEMFSRYFDGTGASPFRPIVRSGKTEIPESLRSRLGP